MTIKDELIIIAGQIVKRPKMFMKGGGYFEIADYFSGMLYGIEMICNKSDCIGVQRWYSGNIAFTSSLIWYYHILNTAKGDEEEAKKILLDVIIKYINALAAQNDLLNNEAVPFDKRLLP